MKFLKMFKRPGKGASGAESAPAPATGIPQLIAVAPPNAGKTMHWVATCAIDSEANRREITVTLDAFGECPDVGAQQGGLHDHVEEVGGRRVAAATLRPTCSVGHILYADREKRDIHIRDIPGEWLRQPQAAGDLAKHVGGSQLLLIVLPPEFVFAERLDDHVYRMFEACIEHVVQHAAKTGVPAFVGLCYSKADEYGFEPTGDPRLIPPGQMRRFGTQESRERVCSVAEGRGGDAGRAASRVIERTWRLYEILLRSNARVGAYWISSMSATPGFEPPAAQGVHHVLSDFAKHLRYFAPRPRYTRRALAAGAALVAACGGLGWNAWHAAEQVAAIESFAAWRAHHAFEQQPVSGDVARWRGLDEWRMAPLPEQGSPGDGGHGLEEASSRGDGVGVVDGSVVAGVTAAGVQSVPVDGDVLARQHATIVDAYGALLLINEAVEEQQEYARGERSALADRTADLRRIRPVLARFGYAAHLDSVQRTLTADRRAWESLNRVRDAIATAPSERTPYRSVRAAVARYLDEEARARLLVGRVETYARVGPDGIAIAEFARWSSDRILAEVHDPEGDVSRRLNRMMATFRLLASPGELRSYETVRAHGVELPSSAFAAPGGRSWSARQWKGEQLTFGMSRADVEWTGFQLKRIVLGVVGGQSKAFRIAESTELKLDDGTLVATSGTGDRINVVRPDCMVIHEVVFHLTSGDGSYLQCTVSFPEGGRWAPALRWFLARSERGIVQLDEIPLEIEGALELTAVRGIPGSGNMGLPEPLDPRERKFVFDCLASFMQRWADEPGDDIEPFLIDG